MESPYSSLCNLEYEVTSSSFSDLIDCPVLGYSLWDRHLFMPDSCFEVTPATDRFNDSLSPFLQQTLNRVIMGSKDFEENPKDALTRATIGVLKNRHKLLSDMPGSNLDPETLCLRNAYFKLNYLKRKLRRAMISSSPSVSSPWTPISTACIGTEGDEEDMDIPLKELLRRSKASPPSFVNVVTPVMIEGVPPNG
nr:protein RKD1 [Ipomoea trifida]